MDKKYLWEKVGESGRMWKEVSRCAWVKNKIPPLLTKGGFFFVITQKLGVCLINKNSSMNKHYIIRKILEKVSIILWGEFPCGGEVRFFMWGRVSLWKKDPPPYNAKQNDGGFWKLNQMLNQMLNQIFNIIFDKRYENDRGQSYE